MGKRELDLTEGSEWIRGKLAALVLLSGKSDQALQLYQTEVSGLAMREQLAAFRSLLISHGLLSPDVEV